MGMKASELCEAVVLVLISLSVVHYAVVFYGTMIGKIAGGAVRLLDRLRSRSRQV